MSVCVFLSFSNFDFFFMLIFRLRLLLIDFLVLFSCKKLVAAKKQMSILQAPNILVIQLKVGWFYSVFVENRVVCSYFAML